MAPLIWKLDTVVFDCGIIGSVLFCLALAVGYVGSLYIGTSRKFGRDHPTTIKERFKRVSIVCALAIPFFWIFSSKSHSVKSRDVFTWLGLRLPGCILASVLPLLLTMILFLGPLTLHYLDGIFRIYRDRKYWSNNFRNLIWIRNHIVGPITEEFVFRACMLPVLVPCFGENISLVICPLFFGVAHLHHMYENVREGVSVKSAFFKSAFQFSYTTVFGIYSAFLFLRTGHLIAPILTHAFCNHMGFPDFQEVLAYRLPTRYYVIASFVAGLIVWSLLLFKFTDPDLYYNDLYFKN